MVVEINRVKAGNSGYFRDISLLFREWLAITRIDLGFEAGVCVFGLGLLVYFALPFEPDLRIVFALLLVLMGCCWFFRNSRVPICLGLTLASLGLFRATWHSAAVKAPILPPQETSYSVQGRVVAAEKSGSRERWRIAVNAIDGLREDETPKYVRVRIDTSGGKVGDLVSFRARLKAPPGPSLPQGYNSARAAYYQQIGGYGFAISTPELMPNDARPDITQKLAQIRYSLADRILDKAPPDTAGLQVALLTGIRTYIPDYQTDVLRSSGLAHILAISGLHLGLMSGSVFFLMTLFLASIIPLSRAMDVRKPAAFVAILAATAYLALSGASVATQRAYIMAIIVFAAVLLDRRAFSMRSVAIAAFVTLMLHPEAILSPGFQMSFAAVIALIAVYQSWDERRTHKGPWTWWRRFWVGNVSLALTSLVAGAATGVFAAFHFKRVARFGLIGNLFAMPVFTFVVMPAGLASYVFMIFGAEALPLWIMGKGLNAILGIAGYVSDLQNALAFIPQASNFVLLLYGAGFLGLCMSRRNLPKVLSVIVIGISFVFWGLSPIPHVRVSENADMTVWMGAEAMADNPRRDKFGRMQFLEQSGQPLASIQPLADHEASQCDPIGCLIVAQGKTVALLQSPEGVLDACKNADLIVVQNRPSGMVARRACEDKLVDLESLRRTGALNIYLEDNLRFQPVKSRSHGARPWQIAY